MTRGIGARGETAGIAVDQVVGPLDLDPAVAGRTDHDIVAGGKAGLAEHIDGNRDLVLARDPAQRFTILPSGKGAHQRHPERRRPSR